MRFKAGDRVRVKTWDELIEEGYKLNGFGCITVGEDFFTKKMRAIEGKTCTVGYVADPFYYRLSDSGGVLEWCFTEGMVAPIVEEEPTNDTTPMTYEKAHAILEDFQRKMTTLRGALTDDFIEAIEANGVAILALEKQIPKKPIHKHKNYYCPVCGEDGWVLWDDADPNDFDNFCGKCGQALDWSDGR